jgi:large subunit ribosomal protein L30
VPAKPQAKHGPGKLRVKQVRSGIGHAAPLRRTLRAIGLKHHQDVVLVADTPSMRGMIFKVRHLVAVTKVEEG